MSNLKAGHERWMKRALQLAGRGRGLTRPNPPVGAVVVKGGRIVGEGYHHRAGGPHAEIHALRQAGQRSRGSILYVTLEPCCTWGRTPPCTEAIVAAGIKQVVVSVRDPNPKHAGKGLKLLRRQGVKVVEGVCASEGGELIAPFSKWITTKKPFLTLKLAMSLDGKLADSRGNARWISGEASRNKVQDLRRQVDAILVGSRTIQRDNPSLLPRPTRGRKPFRIVVAVTGRIPARSQILTDDFVKQTIIVVSSACSDRKVRLLEKTGAQVIRVASAKGHIKLGKLVEELGKLGILHMLCEGGAELAEALIREGLVDEYWFFIAPCIIGGRRSVTAVAGEGWLMPEKRELTFQSVEWVGRDLLIRAKPK